MNKKNIFFNKSLLTLKNKKLFVLKRIKSMLIAK